MSLTETAKATSGRLHGRDAEYAGVSTDTRTLQDGELFVALVGPNFDGHRFVGTASERGAVGAMISKPVETGLPTVSVADTRLGLGQLASYWRSRFDIPVVGVTGSNGKTTVKEMIAGILGESGPCCVTQGNLNNDIGVPLTLLKMRADHRYAVIEMGMNHLGEIAYVSGLARPTVSVITNAAEAHLEGLGSIEAVARAKGEIFSGSDERSTVVINADDTFFDYWKTLAGKRRCISFGLDNRADVSADYETSADGLKILLKCSEGETEMKLPLYGKHNVMNALAASAAAMASGSNLTDIRNGLEKLKSVAGRLEVKTGLNGARVLDDTYNANPASVAAGLQVLKESQGQRVLVLGDMAELGDAASEIHTRVGELARRVGADRVFGIGELTRHAVKSFGKGGKHYDDQARLIDDLRKCMNEDMTVLVKGSRKMHMERVVEKITEHSNAVND